MDLSSLYLFFFFKQKTAYEMRISDWSSDVCSSDLYDAVLTHGFALDGHGRKMSKSLGNVVDPLKVMGESGADILRMWVASTDYFDDVRIGKEVLAGTTDAYRKLRNTFRYLLGALDGFTDADRLGVHEMPELDR